MTANRPNWLAQIDRIETTLTRPTHGIQMPKPHRRSVNRSIMTITPGTGSPRRPDRCPYVSTVTVTDSRASTLHSNWYTPGLSKLAV